MTGVQTCALPIWPNDVLFDDAKLGGILVELQTEPRQSDRRGLQAVIGIGLNLEAPAATPDEPLTWPVAGLIQTMPRLPERHALLAQLLVELAGVLDDFAANGFRPLRTEWQRHNAWQDCPVRLLRDGEVECEGICRGADDDGALLIETAAGVQRCLSGDLSLRAA